MKSVWIKFSLIVAGWLAAAGAVHFLTTIFLGAPPEYVVPGLLVLGALHIGLIDRTPLPAGDGRMLKRGLALSLATLAFWLATGAGAEERIPWVGYSEEILEAARQVKRPVMIDFSSRHCAPCVDMERKVFSSRRVANAAKEFLAVRASFTDTNAVIQALADRFGVDKFPTIVFLGADGQERRNLRLVGFEDALSFAQRVESAR